MERFLAIDAATAALIPVTFSDIVAFSFEPFWTSTSDADFDAQLLADSSRVALVDLRPATRIVQPLFASSCMPLQPLTSRSRKRIGRSLQSSAVIGTQALRCSFALHDQFSIIAQSDPFTHQLEPVIQSVARSRALFLAMARRGASPRAGS
jgi:hypothetical protein